MIKNVNGLISWLKAREEEGAEADVAIGKRMAAVSMDATDKEWNAITQQLGWSKGRIQRFLRIGFSLIATLKQEWDRLDADAKDRFTHCCYPNAARGAVLNLARSYVGTKKQVSLVQVNRICVLFQSARRTKKRPYPATGMFRMRPQKLKTKIVNRISILNSLKNEARIEIVNDRKGNPISFAIKNFAGGKLIEKKEWKNGAVSIKQIVAQLNCLN